MIAHQIIRICQHSTSTVIQTVNSNDASLLTTSVTLK